MGEGEGEAKETSKLDANEFSLNEYL